MADCRDEFLYFHNLTNAKNPLFVNPNPSRHISVRIFRLSDIHNEVFAHYVRKELVFVNPSNHINVKIYHLFNI